MASFYTLAMGFPLASVALLLSAGAAATEASPYRLDVTARLDPAAHRVDVSTSITFDEAFLASRDRSVVFLLHAGLVPSTTTSGARVAPLGREATAAEFRTGSSAPEIPSAVPTTPWRLTLRPGSSAATLSYAGVIDHPIETRGEDYARSFATTPGLVGGDGVYLAGSSVWVPWLGDRPFPFTLDARVPAGWDVVSQGRRTRHERGQGGTDVRWDSPEPQTEVYLVAGPFVESSRPAGPVEVEAFLRRADPALAAKYLEAATRYLRMYEELLGPYPFAKFALVENFWETGWGMPSFTLLGSKVIRLPFILNSSYPHEILHNWWGNGVYVDPARGNWCEGLTAYLADHLIQEQQGTGADYRQATLQKYADYAARGKDLPLAEFRERHSPATEAVGYGKGLMLFHALRRTLGDDVFARGLRQFYEANRFRAATFDDVRRSLESASGRDLTRDFAQAVDRPGAPRLAARDVTARTGDGAWALSGTLAQTQGGGVWRLEVPIAVTLEGVSQAWMGKVVSEGPTTPFSLAVPARPVRVDVDPEFDLFRLLDPRETPPALSGAFGAERSLAILPSAAPDDLREAYRTLATDWAENEPSRIEIKLDTEVSSLPADRAAWVFGWENRWLESVAGIVAAHGAVVNDDGVRFDATAVPRSNHAVVAVARHPARADLAIAWVAADRAKQVPGLGRKLPHYHKYSFLAFEGDEPANVAKGRWPVNASPLTVLLPGVDPATPRGGLAPRHALATLPPAYSVERLREAVDVLADPSLQGRAAGSGGAAKAVEWIAEAFRSAGLRPGGDDGGFVRHAVAASGGRDVTLANVVGVVPGVRPEFEGQTVFVGAHFDHLGLGDVGAREGQKGKIHPGADDNASGVAALIELSRAIAEGPPPDRTVVFVAFDGEEIGRLGSKALVAGMGGGSRERVRGMVNLDTVGRLGSGKLLVLGTGSASEWAPIARGAGFVTGVPVDGVANDPGGSDQVSFHEAGIPAVQLFTGPHLDYHTPSDTPDKIDVPGLAKVVAVAREIVDYLAGRVEPLTPAPAGSASGPPGGSATGSRRVFLGVVPDFAFAGPGVRLSGVVPGSPVASAGLVEGDVLVRVGGDEVKDLKAYSEKLKSLAPGDAVKLTVVRDGREISVTVTAAAR